MFVATAAVKKLRRLKQRTCAAFAYVVRACHRVRVCMCARVFCIVSPTGRQIYVFDATVTFDFINFLLTLKFSPGKNFYFFYCVLFVFGCAGLICSEGALWRNQRKHVIDWLKDLGMTKKQGNARKSMEQRIKSGVIECMKVTNKHTHQHM